MFSRLTFLLRPVKRPLPVLLAAWSLLVTTAAAQGGFSATVSWDPSTSTNVASYKIQYGTSSNNKTNIIFADAATTSLEISNFNAGTTYFFAVKTVDSSGNLSAFSPEAYFSAPAAPKLFTKTWSDESGSFLEVTTGLNLSRPCVIQFSFDLSSWENLGNFGGFDAPVDFIFETDIGPYSQVYFRALITN